MMQTINIMIVGVGGQGTLLTSRILGGLALAGGYDVKLSEVHGMAQRGGSVVTYVRYGEKVAEPIVEEGQADVIIAFEKLEALRYAHFLKKDGALIVNDKHSFKVCVSFHQPGLNGIAQTVLCGLVDDIERLKCLHTGQRLSIGASRRKAHGKVGLALAGVALYNRQLSKGDIGKP